MTIQNGSFLGRTSLAGSIALSNAFAIAIIFSSFPLYISKELILEIGPALIDLLFELATIDFFDFSR